MLAGLEGQSGDGRSLIFEAANHDDILAIVERMSSQLPFDSNTAASLGVGLKLFSEVTLVHRHNPLFANVRPAVGEFIRELKQRPVEIPSN